MKLARRKIYINANRRDDNYSVIVCNITLGVVLNIAHENNYLLPPYPILYFQILGLSNDSSEYLSLELLLKYDTY